MLKLNDDFIAEKHIYLIAGEASGDFLGAQLMKAVKEKAPDTKFSGVGGPLMEEEGLESLFPMNDLSVMGLWEVLPKLKLLLKRIKQTIVNIKAKSPDVVVTIDAPDFSFRVIKGVRKQMDEPPKCIHYVAPTVWAWRPKRAQKIAKFLDGIICLFGFEPPYFEKEGLKAISVGHPMMESGLIEARPAPLGAPDTQKIGLFFGSRQGEIKRISPVILEVVRKILNEKPNVEFIVPTLPHLKAQIEDLLQNVEAPIHISTDKLEKWSVFKACDVALAVSGTVGLELAAANVPHVIAYKMSSLTFRILKRFVQTPYAHLANIIIGHEVVPEFIQDDCVSDDIASELLTLMENDGHQQHQIESFIDVRQSIYAEKSPSHVAADFILTV